MLDMSMLPGLPSSSNPALQTLHGVLEVHIERAEDGKNLIMGLIAKGCVDKTCMLSKNIFNNSLVPGTVFVNYISKKKLSSPFLYRKLYTNFYALHLALMGIVVRDN